MIYYFNVRRGDEVVRDIEGSEVPDLEAAREEALEAARELMSAAIRRGEDVSDRVFEIIEDDDGVIAEVPFASAVVRLH